MIARASTVPLRLLEHRWRYRAHWDINPCAVVIEEQIVTGGETFAVHLEVLGGVAVRFFPVK